MVRKFGSSADRGMPGSLSLYRGFHGIGIGGRTPSGSLRSMLSSHESIHIPAASAARISSLLFVGFTYELSSGDDACQWYF